MTGPSYDRLAWFRPAALTACCFLLITFSQLAHSQLIASDWKQDPKNPNRFWFVGDKTEVSPLEPGQVSQGPSPPLPPPDPNDKDLYLHAYDSTKCGQFANFRDWQKQENAYNCWQPSARDLLLVKPELSRRQRAGTGVPRIVDGERANEGEFPFYVKLKIYTAQGKIFFCGGTLIHDNIVVTVAHCLAGGVSRITVTLGTNYVNGYGGINVDADKWCTHFEFNPANDTQRDLAMVRLREPVRYEVNRIVPACLYSHVRHQDRALCSAIGMGYVNGFEPATNLMVLPARRRCQRQDQYPFSSCYVADYKGTTCPGDSGAPVLCYDKCGETKLTTRAFVVGAVSWGPFANRCIPGGPLWNFMVSDFNWMHKSIEYLVVAMRNDYNLPYGYAQCTLTFKPPRKAFRRNPNWTQ